MKKKKLYILVAIAIAVLFMLFAEYEEGPVKVAFGWNRTINWGWNFGF